MRQSQTADTSDGSGKVADASDSNWVDTRAPAAFRPYLRLARADRPIGGWLLMWPCWWGTALAAHAAGESYPDPWHLFLFFVGSFVMRAAGCVYNDLVDHNIDAQVERTRSRPLPSGQVTRTQAKIFIMCLLLTGLIVLLQFNRFTIVLGMASMLIVAAYPFMKRITNWPQSVLGLAFAWGALVAWSARHGTVETPAIILYIACVLWIVAYDTIYAHQDREDDAMIGLGSTALKFGERTRPWLIVLFSGALGGIAVAAYLAGAGLLFALALTAVTAHIIWQITTLDIHDSANCLSRFKSNHHIGWMIFIGLTADLLVR